MILFEIVLFHAVPFQTSVFIITLPSFSLSADSLHLFFYTNSFFILPLFRCAFSEILFLDSPFSISICRYVVFLVLFFSESPDQHAIGGLVPGALYVIYIYIYIYIHYYSYNIIYTSSCPMTRAIGSLVVYIFQV